MGLLGFAGSVLKVGIDVGIKLPVGVVRDVVAGEGVVTGKSPTVQALKDSIKHLEEAAGNLDK